MGELRFYPTVVFPLFFRCVSGTPTDEKCFSRPTIVTAKLLLVPKPTLRNRRKPGKTETKMIET